VNHSFYKECLKLIIQIVSHVLHNTGRFVMFSVNTNIYNKKTKGPILMDLFTATGKLFFFKQLEMFNVWRVTRSAHMEHL
jgi:hypothetical protein